MFHGGVHFDAGTGSYLKQGDGVKVIADGEVVAYRLDSAYPELTYPTTPPRYALYSTGFVLVRHRLVLPPAPKPTGSPAGGSGAPAPAANPADASGAQVPQIYQPPADEVLEFYSLYMHQLDWAGYQAAEQTDSGRTQSASSIHRLPFWQGDRLFRVGAKAKDRLPVSPASPADTSGNADTPQTGVRICDRASGSVIGLLPRGGELIVGPAAKGWAQIATITKATPVGAVTDVAPAPGATTGWVNLDELDAVTDPNPLDTVVVLDTPFKIRAGDVVGYLGEYQNSTQSSMLPPRPMHPLLHVEVFTGAPINDFIQKSQERANRLGDKVPGGKTLLVIQQGAKLVKPADSQSNTRLAGLTLVPAKGDPGKGAWAWVQPVRLPAHGNAHHAGGTPVGNPLWVEREYAGKVAGAVVQTWTDFPLQSANAQGPVVGYQQVISRAQLDQLRAASNATDDQDKGGLQWRLIDASDSDGEAIYGWVCEKGHPDTLWQSPWVWPHFDMVDTAGIPVIDLYRRNLFETKQLLDGEEREFAAVAAKVSASPLFAKLEEAARHRGSGKGNAVVPADLKRALTVPWLAQAVSHLIVNYENEWGGDMSKWAALSPLMGDDGEPIWQTELERIENLQWWDKVSAVTGFPASPNVWHIHPIGLVGNFIDASICIPLPKAQLLALTISSGFEGNQPMDYGATAGNFDGMGISYGLIQWNAGSGTLAPVLSAMRSVDPVSFKAAFPPESNYDILDSAISSGNNGDLYDWAVNQQSKNPSGWKAPFQNLANIQAFKDIQIATAVNERHHHVMAMIEFLRSLSSDLMKKVELVSYCVLFDVAVQQQSLTPAVQAIKSRVASDRPATQSALVRIAVEERASAAKHVYVADCMSRRIGILQQSPYAYTAFGHTSQRRNANFNLISQDAHAYVCQI